MGLSSKVLLLTVSLAVVGSLGAHAYPIPPVPLWSLVEQAETIVVARVVKVEEPRGRGEDDDMPLAVATLRVLETWKGAEQGEIEVRFPAGLICPAPPRYFEGEDVVAFLAGEDEGWGRTVGLSYGTLYPEGREELGDLREMVHRAIALQARRSVNEVDRIDWLVEAAIRPGTRWHGLYELEPAGDELRSYYDPDRPRKGTWLSPAQREKIAHAFASRPWTDSTLPIVLRILARHADPKVDEAAASAIEGVLGEKDLPYWTSTALEFVLLRYGDKQAAKKIGKLQKGCCDYDEKGLRTLWQRAQRELGIPKVAPVKTGGRKVRGVGPETPD
ncbi:MAG TPA: hypothetical protein VF789_16460 [Thermoanaerobaculia bacterium]